jgi:hypothetical protein
VKRALLLAVAGLVLLAGCAGDDEATTTDATTTTTPSLTADGRVYWLRDAQVWPAARSLDTPAVAESALASLFEGPTAQEETDLDFTTAIPAGSETPEVAIEDRVATLEADAQLSDEALAQVVYTLTQFSTVDSVEIDDVSYTRANFEEQTPPVLVESPLPFEEVTSPLRATGTANTFEANFNYELTDTDGLIVDENFVTATSGTGTRGTFDFTTKPYTVPFDGIGALIVFEHSAKDGSRMNVVEIPLRMSK